MSTCRRLIVLLAIPLLSTGCNLLNTTESEQSVGRGARSFDPYAAERSGAIKLVLQNYKGCATAANGTPYGKGAANFPYPDQCESFDYVYRRGLQDAGPPMELLTGTNYFLGQLTLMDQSIDEHSSPEAAADWIVNESAFKDLDWTNLGVLWDRFHPNPDFDPAGRMRQRFVNFSGATWMTQRNSSFLVEILDSEGVTRSQQLYERNELLAENPGSLHTQVMWEVFNQAPPQFPGDKSIRPGSPTVFGGITFFLTFVRIDFSGTANPFKTIPVIQGLSGDGAIRVTWTSLPQRPFYFPVRFVDPASVPQNCIDADGFPVPCSFGLEPKARFTAPANGEFYEPGEELDVKVEMKDSAGNFLHPPDRLPSWADYRNGNSNGLLLTDFSPALIFLESEHVTGFKMAGPLHKMRPAYDPNEVPFTALPKTSQLGLGTVGYKYPGHDELPAPTRRHFKIPEDAEPGTYVAFVKGHRQFMGERFSKTRPFFFQVGQTQTTQYPGRVGNCQICHRGVLSLDNLMHGLSVDHIEGCKSCHTYSNGPAEVSPLLDTFHRIHMSSDKYPLQKRDCTVCHLTRESALRPSIQVCGTCHQSIHGDKYFAMEQGTGGEFDRFSNCAQACHVVTAPTQHILPAE